MASIKYSRQREVIRQHLADRTDHPTAEMIYTALKPEDPKLSLGTVYRNLALLTELGEVRRIQTGFGPDRYDGNMKEHYHFLCRQCGRVFDIFPEHPRELLAAAGSWQEGEIEQVALYAYGICSACGETQDASSGAD